MVRKLRRWMKASGLTVVFSMLLTLILFKNTSLKNSSPPVEVIIEEHSPLMHEPDNQDSSGIHDASAHGQCRPRDTVYFLKTHKCASTTVQRIFLMYGWNKGLSFVLPETRNLLGTPIEFLPSDVPSVVSTPDNRYDMFVLHARFHPPSVKKLMKENSPWVTILREPVAVFDSLWSYFDMHKFYGVNLDTFSKFINLNGMRRTAMGLGLNQMMFDLGYNMPLMMDAQRLLKSFRDIDDLFELVMIAERLDESLVLLKHLMCWSSEDIAYISLNFRMNAANMSSIPFGLKIRLRKLNFLDAMLYDFFMGIFNQKVKNFGHGRMKAEVEELQAAKDKLFDECAKEVLEDWDPETNGIWENRNIVGWKLKNNSTKCRLLLMTEIEIISLIRRRQIDWKISSWTLDLTKWKIPEEKEELHGFIL